MSENKHQIGGEQNVRLQIGKKSFAPEDIPRRAHAVTKNHHLAGTPHATHFHGLDSANASNSSGLLRTDKRPSVPVKETSVSNQDDDKKT